MAQKILGVTAMGGGVVEIVARIQEYERMGIPAVWLTAGTGQYDALTLFAVAAARTEHIKLGTSIIPTWPRHPVLAVQQVQVLARVAPRRFRFGVGPSHKNRIEQVYGTHFESPLSNLREYLHVVKTLMREGRVDFEGKFYRAHATIDPPISDVPVMGSALRRRAYELCGSEADGAISWMCPGPYLRDVALPVLRSGAQKAGREDAAAVRAAARKQLSASSLREPDYIRMLEDAGYPEVAQGVCSDELIDTLVIYGSDTRIADRLQQFFELGASEILASPFPVGQDRERSIKRTTALLSEVARSL